MGGKIKDLKGKRSGRLVAIEMTGDKKNNNYLWLCKCDCGKEVVIRGASFSCGEIKSCGCLLDDHNKKNGSRMFVKNFKSNYIEGTCLMNLGETIPTNNTSGIKGVRWVKERKLWNARLTLRKTLVLNDFYANKQDAINARKEAEEKYFKPILEKYGKTQ